MAQPHQHRHRAGARARARARGAFTLIEIITVVVIITLLVAITLPALNSARKKAQVTRAAADLAAIETAIQAYRTDFSDIPRPDGPNVGFALLGKTMLSPGPSVGPIQPQPLPAGTHQAGTTTSIGTPGTPEYREYVSFGRPDSSGGFTTTALPSDTTQWAVFPVSDGKDGPGFRVRPGGQPFNSYLQESKFRVRGLAILDQWDNPILYFPARPGKPTPNAQGEWALLPLTVPNGDAAFYNAFHNITFFMRPGDNDLVKARKRMEAVLVVPGDNDYDGVMETSGGKNERAVTDKAILLWSAGPNGNFGATFAGADPTPDEVRKVDDVTNFSTGQ